MLYGLVYCSAHGSGVSLIGTTGERPSQGGPSRRAARKCIPNTGCRGGDPDVIAVDWLAQLHTAWRVYGSMGVARTARRESTIRRITGPVCDVRLDPRRYPPTEVARSSTKRKTGPLVGTASSQHWNLYYPGNLYNSVSYILRIFKDGHPRLVPSGLCQEL